MQFENKNHLKKERKTLCISLKFETICVTPIDFENSNIIRNKQYDVYSSPAVCALW